MVTVEFLGPIALPPREVEATTLHDLATAFQNDETILPWLKECAVAVNGKIVKEKNTPLKEGDKISLLPPVCGG
jgi:molybdopterin synthase sulfur carrier subunit